MGPPSPYPKPKPTRILAHFRDRHHDDTHFLVLYDDDPVYLAEWISYPPENWVPDECDWRDLVRSYWADLQDEIRIEMPLSTFRLQTDFTSPNV
jgi:hypothetical protein